MGRRAGAMLNALAAPPEPAACPLKARLMKRKNVPALIIIMLMSVLYIIPSVWMLVTLLVTGRFEFPFYVFEGLSRELGFGFLIAFGLLFVPVLLVLLVERSRRRGGSQRRSLGLTLGLLVGLMLVMTAVPLVSTLLRGAGALPLGEASPILVFGALPLLVVAFTVLVLAPGLLRDGDGGSRTGSDA